MSVLTPLHIALLAGALALPALAAEPGAADAADHGSQAKAAEPKPADTKPADTKAADTKPSDAKPSEGKSGEAKSGEAKAADAKPAETKAAETKPSDAKPSDAKAAAKPRPAAKPKVAATPAAPMLAAANPAPASLPAPAMSPPVMAAAPSPAAPHPEPHWAYEGPDGPDTWAQLAPEFAACGSGHRQSPIDIREGIRLELEPISVDYRESAFRVIDTGHTIQANVSAGNFIRVMGRRYSLVQFHFHHPAEELIEGHQAEMVVHLVHKDSEGRLAVIAVQLERGERQPEIQAVFNNLPLEKNEELPAAVRIDPAHLLPEDRRYYTYMGSLTTPPCTEGVLWIVMKQPLTVSPEQLALFSRLYPFNARPVQALAGRMIKESE